MKWKSKTYNVVVLKKTKLAESDLILTMLAQDGSQLRAVAKGARKPNSIFSAILDIACECQVDLAKGKNLDIVQKAKLIRSNENIRDDYEKYSLILPPLELLSKTTGQDVECEKLFDLTKTFLNNIYKSDDFGQQSVISAAQILKSYCFLGVMPQVNSCINCGSDMSGYISTGVDLPISLSFDDGGILCRHCKEDKETSVVTVRCIKNIDFLISSDFETLKNLNLINKEIYEIFDFCKVWSIVHFNVRLRSLDIILDNLKGFI